MTSMDVNKTELQIFRFFCLILYVELDLTDAVSVVVGVVVGVSVVFRDVTCQKSLKFYKN